MASTTPTVPTVPSLKDIKDLFGYPTLAAFSKDWKELTDKDKEQIKEGIGNGTLTY